MLKPLPTFIILCISIVLFTSCSSTRQAGMERYVALQDAKIPAQENFIRFSDGTIKNYSSIKLVTGVYKSPHLLVDGNKKIYPEQILAYQNKNHFAISAAGFSYGGHKSNLATETLPGFAVRIAAGKLNVYIKKYKVGNKVTDEFFLQEGNGQILTYSPELMDALIKNNPEALDFFNNNQKRIKLTKQLKATANIYNETYFNTVASSGKEKVK